MENSQFNPMGILYFLISIFCSVSFFGLAFVWFEEICSQLNEKFLYKLKDENEIKMNININFLKIFSLSLFLFNVFILFLVPKNEVFFDSFSVLCMSFSVLNMFFVYIVLSCFGIGINKFAMFIITFFSFLLSLVAFAIPAGMPEMVVKVSRMFYV